MKLCYPLDEESLSLLENLPLWCIFSIDTLSKLENISKDSLVTKSNLNVPKVPPRNGLLDR